jgi:hypothetical protein
MKKVLLGLILGLLMFPAIHEIDSYTTEVMSFIPHYGFMKPFEKMCTKDISKNGHGWVFVRRDYYRCGTLSIIISDFIHGEYTKPRNPELEKQVNPKARF